MCGAELKDDHFLDHDCPLEGKFKTPMRSYSVALLSIASDGVPAVLFESFGYTENVFYSLESLFLFAVILPPERAECQSYKVAPENGDPSRRNAKNDVSKRPEKTGND